jgi:ABC-2 type transport system ATP-binding protein
VGYLPEHNPLYLDMYITEYLQFTGSVYHVRNCRERVEEMIACTGLTPERHKKIGALSKGYRQRVGLAQALMPDPDVLILDEPTTGLDPNQIAGVRDLIQDLGKSKTVLLSTHIMQEVKAICERVIIIHNGGIVADARANDLESLNLKEEQVVEVTFDRLVAPELLGSIQGVAGFRESANGYTIESVAGVDVRPALFRFAVENNLVILEMMQKQQSLEAIFHALTRG